MKEGSSVLSHTRGLRILGITYGLGSNKRDLIFNDEFFEPGEIQSLITNWRKIENIPYRSGLDAYAYFLDHPDRQFSFDVNEHELLVCGDLSRLDREGLDRRWSLLGNMGLFFRYALSVQERHGIYALHASAIYKPEEHELMVVVGKAGTGKTVYLLEGLIRGYQIFSTEMTYFRILPEGVIFYIGALIDNIRVGSFLVDFPQATERLGLVLPRVEEPWSTKISVDMQHVSTECGKLTNPTLSFIFPRIETGYKHAIVGEVENPRMLARLLFDSASEKIGNTILMYEEIPTVGFDNPTLSQARWKAITYLVASPQWEIKQAKSVLAGPKCCMEGID